MSARGRPGLPGRDFTFLTICATNLQETGAEAKKSVVGGTTLGAVLYIWLCTPLALYLNPNLISGPQNGLERCHWPSVFLFPVWPQKTNLLSLLFIVTGPFNWHTESAYEHCQSSASDSSSSGNKLVSLADRS